MRHEMQVLLIPYGAEINLKAIAVADYIFDEVNPGDWRVKKSRIDPNNVLLVTAGSMDGQPVFTRPYDG